MNHRYFILQAFSLLSILVGFYISIFYFQLGAPVEAEWWIKNCYDYKDFKASIIKEPKIIILSGSNSLLGINSAIIEKETNYKVVNLSSHAALDLNFFYTKLKAQIKKNDIVVMPLEFDYFNRKNELSNWFSNNMMAWGKKSYLDLISVQSLAHFIFNTSKTRVFEGFNIQTSTNQKKIVSSKEVLTNLDSIWYHEGVKWRGYTYTGLNEYGDLLADQPLEHRWSEYNGAYIIDSAKVSEYFVSVYKKISKLVKDYQGQLILTYPCTMRSGIFDLTVPENRKLVDQLIQNLKEHDISISFNPALFNLDIKFFFNSNYHLNYNGAIIRSTNLAECLAKKLNGSTSYFLSYKDAIKKTRKLENYFSENPSKMAVSEKKQISETRIKTNIKIRLSDLKKLKIALQKYFTDSNSYPITAGFDAVVAKWGDSRTDWIKGLAPKYIEKLPIDPECDNAGIKQYYYKSNGKDYKLIAHDTRNDIALRILDHQLIDPERSQWAYGYWTEGAKNW